ncbi:uncharacterized protein LOC115925046 [Strongylocentrotus purpuratus]|uniref:ZU5 domain-containing protein n=1 Tax=Strongylocentrotus purpuratus TaxID=7668 RepID=A0A7M7P0J7_STRPU|nr:uncharacterized protein LOC115925046 [Strongylocentrotus purpuratus]
MLIPPEAVHQSDPCKITLTLLQDPPSVDIQDDESVVCYGIRCDPPNMIFHQPVKIRIPHYSLVMNPDQGKPNIVSRVLYPGTDVTITSRKRSSSSPNEPPYCRVYKRHLELYIGKCAEWWVLIPLEQQVIQHQLKCTPYIPDKIERGQEFEVHLHMHADLPGMETDIRKEKKQQSYHKSHRSVPFSVESKSGDVAVTCHREGKQVESKVLSLKDVCGKMRHNLLLSVTSTDEEFTGITITITQAGRLGMSRSIAFIIRHTGIVNLSSSNYQLVRG